MGTKQKVLLILSGLLPVFGLFKHQPETMLLIYPVFVVVVLVRRHCETLVGRLPGPVAVHLVCLFLLAGSLAEALAWLGSYLKADPHPALFRPQLIVDLMVGVGFYGGWAAAWWLTLCWFRFTLLEVFLVTGILGIGFEQLGAVFVKIFQTFTGNPLLALLLALLMAAYLLVVYGSIAGLAMIPLVNRLAAPQNSRSWVRFPVVIGLMIALAMIGCLVVNLSARAFGGFPPERSIIEHPFW